MTDACINVSMQDKYAGYTFDFNAAKVGGGSTGRIRAGEGAKSDVEAGSEGEAGHGRGQRRV